MEALLVKYGYALLFVGVAVEGEAFLLAGAFLAHRGILHLPLVILVAIASNCAADQIYYGLARTRGYAWLERRFGDHRRYKELMARMSRFADWLLLASRYAFGFRIIIPAACGALRMPLLRFFVLNLIAGAIWAVPTALVGYYSGNAAERLLAGIRKYEIWVVAGLLVAALLILLLRHLRHAEWVEDLRVADLHRLVPILIGVMGAINLVSAIWPQSAASLRIVDSWLPLEVTQRSRPLMLFAGIALLQVMRNLSRRKELAWYVAVTALTVSLLTHITRALDLHHSLVASLLLIYLFIYRHRYYARSDPGSLKAGAVMAPLIALVIFTYGHTGLKHRQENFVWYAGATPVSEAIRSGILVIEPQVDPLTPRPPGSWGRCRSPDGLGDFTCSSCSSGRSCCAGGSRPHPRPWQPRFRRTAATGCRRSRYRTTSTISSWPAAADSRPTGSAAASRCRAATLWPRTGTSKRVSASFWNTAARTAGRRASTKRPKKGSPFITRWASAPSRWPKRPSSI